jgi:hypothetical protein
VVEKQGIVDQIEVASDPNFYTTLETDLFPQCILQAVSYIFGITIT